MNKLKRIFILFLSTVLLLTGNTYVQAAPLRLNVYFFNTGQSDCIFIEFDGIHIVVDSGYETLGTKENREMNQNNINEFLKYKGVEKIDYYIVTHCDTDHYKDITRVTEGIEIDKFIMRDYSETVLRKLYNNDLDRYKNYIHMVNFISQKLSIKSVLKTDKEKKKCSTPKSVVKHVKTLRGKGKNRWLFYSAQNTSPSILSLTGKTSNEKIELAFLNNTSSFITQKTSKEDIASHFNNDSITFSLNYKNLKYLFAGDVYWKGRNQIVKVSKKEGYTYDVYKAAHHGQDNANLYSHYIKFNENTGEYYFYYDTAKKSILPDGYDKILKPKETITIVTNRFASNGGRQTKLLDLIYSNFTWPMPVYVTGMIAKSIPDTSLEDNNFLAIRISTDDGKTMTTKGIYKTSEKTEKLAYNEMLMTRSIRTLFTNQ